MGYTVKRRATPFGVFGSEVQERLRVQGLGQFRAQGLGQFRVQGGGL